MAAVMSREPHAGNWSPQGGKEAKNETHLETESFSGNSEESMHFNLQSPLLFSLIYNKGHKIQLALWG